MQHSNETEAADICAWQSPHISPHTHFLFCNIVAWRVPQNMVGCEAQNCGPPKTCTNFTTTYDDSAGAAPACAADGSWPMCTSSCRTAEFLLMSFLLTRWTFISLSMGPTDDQDVL